MRFLVISPTPSHPANAGNRQRIQALLRGLRRFGHGIDFCFIAREAVGEEDLAAMRGAWDEVILLPHDRAAERRSLGEVYGIDDWFQPAAATALAQLAAERHYDAVLVEYVFFSKALEYFPETTLKIIDSHDVFSDRHERLRALGLPPAFFYTTPAEEGRGLDRADLILAIQDEERAQLEEITRAAVVTLGFVPDPLPDAVPRREGGGARVAGYLGSANPINQAALKAFLQALDLGAVAREGGRIRIGGGAGQAAAGLEGPLEVAGPVAEAAPFYAGLDVALNPHQGGTGLKIKSVEALAHGCPLIGTADALLGLEPEEPFHAAASATALAPALQRFLAEPAFRERVAEGSRRLFHRYAATVGRQMDILRSPAALRLALDRPRVLLVTDLPFWEEKLGNHARICEMLRVGREWIDFDLLVLRSLSPAERAAARRVVGGRGRVFSFRDYALPGVAWIESSPLLKGFERRHFARVFFAALEAHLAAHPCEAVILEYIRLSYLRHARGLPRLTVLDTHDVMSLRAENFAHFGLDHHLQISVQEELAIMDSFALVLAIQAAEHRFLAAALPGRALYLPHSLAHRCRHDAGRPARRVAFVGGDSPMNRDGLRWFLEQVWPCFHGHDAELHVAGGVCASLGPAAARAGRVVLHGAVADLDGFLDAADIGINPVFYGGGLKIKTVEYLCRGLPSVVTQEAVHGIEGGEPGAYRLARSRRDFVAELHLLLTDTEARQHCSEAAYRLGRQQFSRAVSGQALRALADLARAERREAAAA